MPALTRRRDHDRREECWLIYYGDVHVGSIAIRSGIPHDQAPWGWRCGFYPGSEPGECTSGAAPTFDQARANFEVAWRALLPKLSDADFQAYRRQQAFVSWKYAMWDMGCKCRRKRQIGARAASVVRTSVSRMSSGTCWRRTWWNSCKL